MYNPYDSQMYIKSVEELQQLYGPPSVRAIVKELTYLSDHYKQFIATSPFVLIASSGPEGLDISPRGDKPGFVNAVDTQTLLLPDRRGNNRVDTLTNIVRDDRISLIFLIPGVGETLRVNGRAKVLIDESICAEFVERGKVPKSVIAIRVEAVYFQCQKALVRSCLWAEDAQVDRSKLPSVGQILQALDDNFDGAEYDKNDPGRLQETLY